MLPGLFSKKAAGLSGVLGDLGVSRVMARGQRVENVTEAVLGAGRTFSKKCACGYFYTPPAAALTFLKAS